MKKLFILISFTLVANFCFSAPFSNSTELVSNFLENGTFIEVVVDENHQTFIQKNAIVSINIDKDDLKINSFAKLNVFANEALNMVKMVSKTTNKGDNTVIFNLKDYDITARNNNIIITKK